MKNFKPIFILSAMLLISSLSIAQTPQKFNYQAVCRDIQGNIIANQAVSFRLSIHDLAPAGTILYKETHNPTTDNFGLVAIAVGTGIVQTGNFSSIPWGTGDKYLEVELNTGSGFYSVSTSQLLSVPFALYAENANVPGLPGPTGATGAQGPAGFLSDGASAGNTPYWNGTQWVVNSSNIFNNGISVGIGTTNPASKLEISGLPLSGINSALKFNNSFSDGVYIDFGDFRKIGVANGGNLFMGYNFGYNATTNSYVYDGSDEASGIEFSTAGDVILKTAPTGTAGNTFTPTSRLTVKNSGNVGIGTTSPGYKLSILGPDIGTGTGVLQLSTPGSVQGERSSISLYSTFQGGSDNGTRRTADIIAGFNGGAWGKEYLTFNIGNNGAANDAQSVTSEKMRIQSNGNVGIGTSSPTTQLHTTGGVRFENLSGSNNRYVIADTDGVISTSPMHHIGESYGGGIVFYVYDNGQHGLIAPSTDQSAGIPWQVSVDGWNFSYTGTHGDGINSGEMNTAIIVATTNSQTTGNFAAQVCADYAVTVNGIKYGDWYLPDIYEFNLLFLQKGTVGGFPSYDWYWTSNESAYNGAWAEECGFGTTSNSAKQTNYRVRCIRHF